MWEAISQVYTWITILCYNNKSFTNLKKDLKKKKSFTKDLL